MASDYDQIVALMRKQTAQLDAESAAFTIMDSVAAVVDAATDGYLGAVSSVGQAIYGKIKGDIKKPIPNPWFVFNGQEDRASPITIKYKNSRTGKSIAGTLSSVAGGIAASQTAGINVVSSVMHLNATGTTAMHLLQLAAIAKSYPQSKTIGEWLEVVRIMKIAKGSIRGGQFIGGLIPCGSIPSSVLGAIATTGVKLTMTNSVYYTAAAIHWRAFQEQAISGGRQMGTGGKVGPGSKIFWEIFAKRGMTRLLGNHDIAGLVAEPAGWEALADKLLLI